MILEDAGEAYEVLLTAILRRKRASREAVSEAKHAPRSIGAARRIKGAQAAQR